MARAPHDSPCGRPAGAPTEPTAATLDGAARSAAKGPPLPRGRPLRRAALPLFGIVLGALLLAHARALAERTIQALVSRGYPEVPWIDATTLARALNGATNAAPLLLDARSEAEYTAGHLRGAVRFDASRTAPLRAGAERARPIVVYCSVGYRSASIARWLIRRGHLDTRNLAGGIFAWANAGLPVYRGERTVRALHPYALPWGLLLRRELRAEVAR